MPGSLDQSKFGPPVGGGHQIACVRRRNLNVVAPVTNQKSPRWELRDGLHRIDIQDVVIEIFGLEEIAFVADHAGDQYRAVDLLWRSAPRAEMRRRGKRRDTSHSVVACRHRQSQRTTEAEAGE